MSLDWFENIAIKCPLTLPTCKRWALNGRTDGRAGLNDEGTD